MNSFYFHTTARRKGTSSEPVNVAVVSLTPPVCDWRKVSIVTVLEASAEAALPLQQDFTEMTSETARRSGTRTLRCGFQYAGDVSAFFLVSVSQAADFWFRWWTFDSC